jgi:hypothetical protein
MRSVRTHQCHQTRWLSDSCMLFHTHVHLFREVGTVMHVSKEDTMPLGDRRDPQKERHMQQAAATTSRAWSTDDLLESSRLTAWPVPRASSTLQATRIQLPLASPAMMPSYEADVVQRVCAKPHYSCRDRSTQPMNAHYVCILQDDP